MLKVTAESGADVPILTCDICGQRISDMWSDQASMNRGAGGEFTDVVIHHERCAVSQTNHTSIAKFLWMLMYRSGIGDRASDGGQGRVSIGFPEGTSFS
jgi:hypothetical protein